MLKGERHGLYKHKKSQRNAQCQQSNIKELVKKGILISQYKSPNGFRYYKMEQISKILNPTLNVERKIIGYCRISSNKQKDDLKRQVENMKTYLLAKGKPFSIIQDIGSGINYNKKGLQQLIKEITTVKITRKWSMNY